MSRLHECRHDTPLDYDYVKLPTSAQCEELHCYWQRHAADTSIPAMNDVKSLATHHAKALRHHVTIQLRQEVRMVPQGEPMAVAS